MHHNNFLWWILCKVWLLPQIKMNIWKISLVWSLPPCNIATAWLGKSPKPTPQFPILQWQCGGKTETLCIIRISENILKKFCLPKRACQWKINLYPWFLLVPILPILNGMSWIMHLLFLSSKAIENSFLSYYWRIARIAEFIKSFDTEIVKVI